MTAHGNLNLVPLVDILTSIVFFSLLTYTGAAMAMLTAFDLSLPPTVVTQAEGQTSNPDRMLNLLVAVRVNSDGVQVEHSEGLNQRLAGLGVATLDTLEGVMRQVRQQFPQNSDVTVIPSDEVSYDNVVRVLERLRLAGYSGLSLASRARAAQGPPPAAARPGGAR